MKLKTKEIDFCKSFILEEVKFFGKDFFQKLQDMKKRKIGRGKTLLKNGQKHFGLRREFYIRPDIKG